MADQPDAGAETTSADPVNQDIADISEIANDAADLIIQNQDPFFASIWYGIIAVTQGVLPILINFTVRSGTLESITRNRAYKWAHYLTIYGGAAIFAPLIALWPFSYAGSKSLINSYINMWRFMSTWIFVMNGLVTVLLNYNRKNYLFEEAISNGQITLEFYGYVALAFGLFTVTK